MRLQDDDVMRDDIRWDVECDECHAVARWVGTVKVRGLRILDDGSLGWATVRVCRICASRALLLPERRPFADASEMNDPYIRAIEPDPHDLEDDYDDAPELEPPTAPRAAPAADARTRSTAPLSRSLGEQLFAVTAPLSFDRRSTATDGDLGMRGRGQL